MKVLKFGGSSLADGGRIREVAEVVFPVAAAERVAVVLSAMKGVTDLLISAARSAEEGSDAFKQVLETIRGRHFDAVRVLFPPRTRPRRSRRWPSCAMSWRRSSTVWS